MAHTQTALYTVLDTPRHLRAGDSVARPVALLFHDEVLDQLSELKMTPAQARELAACLVQHATAAEG